MALWRSGRSEHTANFDRGDFLENETTQPSENSGGAETPESIALPKNSDDSTWGALFQSAIYGLSVPERTVRSIAALASGAAGESASILIPRVFKDSKSYKVFVQQMLDMLSDDVGGVKKETVDKAGVTEQVENFVAKKTVGTFIDLAGMSMMHVSPLTVLAIVSDVAHGSTFYLKQLADELREQGVINEKSTINSTAELLSAIGNASGSTADEFDTPPIDLQGLKDTIARTRDQVAEIDGAKLIPQSEITAIWNDMNKLAAEENVSLFQLSSAVTMYSLNQVSNVTHGTLLTIRVTGNLLDEHFFDHYRDAMAKISDDGIYTVLSAASKPYLDAVWFNFSAGRPTLTEDLVNGKLLNQAIDGVADWFRGSSSKNDAVESE